jgi:hypothetical protein
MDKADGERKDLVNTVTRLDSRAGYVSVGVGLSIIAVLLTIGFHFLGH